MIRRYNLFYADLRGKKSKTSVLKFNINDFSFTHELKNLNQKDSYQSFSSLFSSHKKMNYLSTFLLVMAIIGLRPSAGIEGAPSTSVPQPKGDCKKWHRDENMITLEKETCVKTCETYLVSDCPVGSFMSICACPHGMKLQYIAPGRNIKCVKPENCMKYS